MPAFRFAIAVPLALAIALSASVDARHRARPAHSTGPLHTGAYVCEGAEAGMFPITILPGLGYRAAGPAGTYVPTGGGVLHFTGGSLANNVGTVTGPASFALTLAGATEPYTHCAQTTKARRRH